MSKSDKCHAANEKFAELMEKKVTLEFSRDRKSMSAFCKPAVGNNGDVGAKLFCKVY